MSVQAIAVPRRQRRRVHRWVRQYGRPWELALRYLLLLGVTVLLVGPLAWQALTSLKGPHEDISGVHATVLPSEPSLHAYQVVLGQLPMLGYIRNSLVICTLTVVSQLVLSTLGGYMLSRPGWRGRNVVFLVLVASMMFPFESVMVSLYIMILGLNLGDNLLGVWLPGFIGAINLLIMRAAFLSVPIELEEAGMLDGAGEWRRFWSVFVPAARGALTVVAINTFIGAWDDFLWPLIVLRTDTNFTITLGLSRLQNSAFGFDWRVVMAGAMVSVVPMLVLFLFTQRYFYRGVAAGAVKL
ncbi:MAG TPA: carbohydrate ABC transporter permease [Candidatus Dormibacteraeota bacterium]|nr:carbohydrate ABC transporter permease [Candidatus Dormibacteraeota bacterium]